MIAIVCIDNNNGMLFNERRQSQDKSVIEDILSIVKESKLFTNSYSASLFDEFDCNITVSENFLIEASENDYCFVETEHLSKVVSKIKKIIIYKWNRDYPSDFKFDIDLELYKYVFSKIETIEFKGNSHDKITREVYTI